MKQTIIVLVLALAGLSAGAQAQIYNPDNDSQAFFASNVPLAAAPERPTGVTPIGTVSPDGHYVFTGGERGWDARPHSYTFVGGRLVHTADCLSMDEPKPQLTAADFEAMRLAEQTSDR